MKIKNWGTRTPAPATWAAALVLGQSGTTQQAGPGSCLFPGDSLEAGPAFSAAFNLPQTSWRGAWAGGWWGRHTGLDSGSPAAAFVRWVTWSGASLGEVPLAAEVSSN